MTKKIYLKDKSVHTLTTSITHVDIDRSVIRLQETIFHPQGGGQKCDVGTIASVNVLKVAHVEDGEVDHFVDSTDGLSVGDLVEIAIDSSLRFQNSKLHSGGHMISYAVESMIPGIKAVSGHHWPGEARVVFDGDVSVVPDDFLDQLQLKLNHMINDGHKINLIGDPFSERRIQFEGGREIPCGGTHVDNCSQLDGINIKLKIKKGQLRVSYSV